MRVISIAIGIINQLTSLGGHHLVVVMTMDNSPLVDDVPIVRGLLTWGVPQVRWMIYVREYPNLKWRMWPGVPL